ncbi:hypothetical protein SAMN05216357_11296 [Porphyromonadaceae bacterium KH3CP3RA]|nr:hypothetical protein SAMN05216357_11296 [Porphyromonadaceae bacterium KH3CP3RA]
MDNNQYQEILAMLTVLYKKIDKIENQLRGGSRSTSDQTFLNELKWEAGKISDKIKG